MYTVRALDAPEYPAWDQLIATSVRGRVGTSQDFVKAGGVPALYWHAA